MLIYFPMEISQYIATRTPPALIRRPGMPHLLLSPEDVFNNWNGWKIIEEIRQMRVYLNFQLRVYFNIPTA
ncbi:hypothetical protein GCK72_022734 [Caenorhabditis remanei]|uniref:Uncharacterized protein n=1 Tax=Caenorhabditis remanei TaxID=31234 RepID=A0A6A5FV58_CAERE|nr:hypothetical protein GCK72_022734 [Caenorhabditis remanei]KAF1746281.1 hypothetical protein GCK72_022734 [Caenorhabditis remanei]